MSQRFSIAPPSGAFRYCLDPVFLTAAVLYGLNRWVFKPLAQGHVHFFAYYGNSLLCIAFCLPPVLFVYRLVGLRDPKSFPTRFEIVSHLIVWSLFFKWLAPQVIKGPFAWVAADPWDVVWYIIGGVIAGGFWGVWRRRPVAAGTALQSEPLQEAK